MASSFTPISAQSLGGATRGAWRAFQHFLRPPAGLQARIRWLFLLGVLFNLVMVVPLLVWGSSSALELR